MAISLSEVLQEAKVTNVVFPAPPHCHAGLELLYLLGQTAIFRVYVCAYSCEWVQAYATAPVWMSGDKLLFSTLSEAVCVCVCMCVCFILHMPEELAPQLPGILHLPLPSRLCVFLRVIGEYFVCIWLYKSLGIGILVFKFASKPFIHWTIPLSTSAPGCTIKSWRNPGNCLAQWLSLHHVLLILLATSLQIKWKGALN